VGARLAVGVASRVLTGALREDPEVMLLPRLGGLVRQIVREWSRAAECDRRLFPFTPAELAHLSAKGGTAARETLSANPLLPYGATLCVVAITGQGLVYLQIGDGDIVTVSDSGKARRPLAADARLFGGETTSLCSPCAAHEFRVAVQAFGNGTEVPALIVVSTDGYANSFRDEQGFLQVGPDLLEMVRAEGLTAVEAGLPGWLEEASRLGSGDDVTVGLIAREIGA
jgi:hypothetical protein